jgi:hypothetical protein
MQLSLNIKNESISKKILDFLSSFQKEDVQIKTISDKSDNKDSLSSFAGIWKDRDIDVNSIRESAWKK